MVDMVNKLFSNNCVPLLLPFVHPASEIIHIRIPEHGELFCCRGAHTAASAIEHNLCILAARQSAEILPYRVVWNERISFWKLSFIRSVYVDERKIFCAEDLYERGGSDIIIPSLIFDI